MTAERKALFQRLSAAIKASNVEFLMVESPMNCYQPPAPPGHFAMRSHKRRLFIALDDGSYPHPNRIQELVDAKLYQEDATFTHD